MFDRLPKKLIRQNKKVARKSRFFLEYAIVEEFMLSSAKTYDFALKMQRLLAEQPVDKIYRFDPIV